MKIAYFVNQYPKTSHSFIRREILALEKLGFDITRITIRHVTEGVVDESDKREQKITRALLGSGRLKLLTSAVSALFTRPSKFTNAFKLAWRIGRRSDRGVIFHLIYLCEACLLRRWLEDARIEHVHAHFGTNSAAVVMLCRLLGGPPYSVTMHGPEEFDRAGVLSLGEKVRYSKFIAAISEFGRSQIYRWSDYADWKKVNVVHCGVDEAFLERARTPAPPAPAGGVPKLVSIGRLVEQKGQLLLVEAAARLAAEGKAFEIVLVGDGAMRAPIEKLSAETNLTGRVRITGWMDNNQVREQLIGAHAMVLPSFAEGLPVVIMEAFATHTPVVSTQIAGIPELVQPGVNGWLVPAGSIDALVEAVRQVLAASPEQLAAMGAAGAAAVIEQHDVNKEAAKLAALIRA